ncbi:TFIIH basal transcription factor complex helicase subunit [Phytophthora infestans T30-4]|uniref:DNA 5'-3' helicase n=1 Tax=Phytophthora infestans (strain T30-4) TaxID=403677 RepID=D0NSC7_PHYIT|nr:TFIIH basal transcription factor complex helicase subunit [Phytophthora infestans T30-4]EEY64472.1 TFIIH basal transcription factor complex helicase subunit [Phytophthora infestans T30-4]|eukprot:XP_002897975.1 TFIIH basal transcription factor complex helicase subunit [Phytophthora infestans T30-4]
MKVDIDGLEVVFPYERMYSEQLQYMRELKRALDAQGHCMLEMPTGTGKTVSLLSLVLAYKAAHPTAGKLVYCTRTVPEMAKCVEEIKKLIKYREHYYGDKAQVTAVCLSSRRNMCVHPRVMAHADGEDVDGQCRKMTASWVETCSFYENYDARKSNDTVLPPGVYSVDDLKELGVKKGWCPYFLTRYVVTFADVVVYNYQYMLDPKVSQLVSRSFEKESIVVFDEAHNIDNVCIEALSVDLDRRSLDRASRNLTTLSGQVNKLKQADKSRLDAEYRRLVEGLRSSNAVVAPSYTDPATNQAIDTSNDIMIANPVLPDDVLDEAIPGNIRRAEHFVAFMRRLIEYLRQRIRVRQVESETPQAFLHHLHQAINMEIKPMKFCYTRLNSLLRTLEVTNLEEYNSLTDVADFATLVATYAEGFMLIIEPFDSASGVHDPVLQLSCLDASLAIRPVFERFSSVVITSGTLSPIDLYPRLLNFNPVIRESLPMSVYRSSICPLVITRGSDQMPVSTKFDLRDDLSVVRNYGTLLLEMAACTPDGMVCFFPSYLYMEKIIGQWDSLGVLKRVLSSKLLFIETKDIVETTLALDNYKKACDCGRGAIFFSVARGKVAEGIDFDRHYGRAVILFGIPFQYTLSNTLRARLEYLRYTHQIREGDFLTFDALRQAAQCAGRVLRSKTDYGLVIFADSRYNRADKRTKLPPWILQFLVNSHLNLSVDMAVFMAKKYLSLMAQPVDESTSVNSILLDADGVAKWLGKHPKEDESMQ